MPHKIESPYRGKRLTVGKSVSDLAEMPRPTASPPIKACPPEHTHEITYLHFVRISSFARPTEIVGDLKAVIPNDIQACRLDLRQQDCGLRAPDPSLDFPWFFDGCQGRMH